MHLFKEHAVKDHDAASEMIPVIDCGPGFAGETDALARVAGLPRRRGTGGGVG